MKKFFSGLALLTAVLLLGSCQDDDIFDWGKKQKHRTYGENEVAFVIGGEKGINTRAEVQQTLVAPTNVIDLPREEGEPQLCLTMTVTSMDDEIFDAVNGATRGTPIYTENFDQVYADQLYVTAFEPGEVPTGTDVTEKAYTEPSDVWGGSDFTRVKFNKVDGEQHTYSYNYSSGDWNLPWPSDGELQFFLQAPTESYTGVTNLEYWPDGSFKFNYATPMSTVNGKSVSKADDQKDLLFGSRIIKKEQNEPDHNAQEVLLYHALSAVKFKMGSSDIMKEQKIAIQSVSIELKGSGYCTVTPNYDDYHYYYDDGTKHTFPESNEKSTSDLTKSASCVVWTSLNPNAVSYYVEFPNTLAGTETGETAATFNFPEGFYKQTTGADGTIADHNLNDGAYSKTFMVIPQEISPVDDNGNFIEADKTYITVNYTINGKSISKQIILPHDVWKAGQLRTFTLDALMVDVSILDVVEGNVKDDLTTTNTGTAAQYQRVMLDANWVFYDKEYGDCIIDTYPIVTEDPSGKTKGYVNIEGFKDRNGNTGFNSDYWFLGSDGFFYYKYPIQPGATPNVPLFSSFTRPTPAANDHVHEGAHVEMTICVQAVKYEAMKTSLMTYWDMSASDGPKYQTLGNADGNNHCKRVESSSNGYIFNQLSTVVEQ